MRLNEIQNAKKATIKVENGIAIWINVSFIVVDATCDGGTDGGWWIIADDGWNKYIVAKNSLLCLSQYPSEFIIIVNM